MYTNYFVHLFHTSLAPGGQAAQHGSIPCSNTLCAAFTASPDTIPVSCCCWLWQVLCSPALITASCPAAPAAHSPP